MDQALQNERTLTSNRRGHWRNVYFLAKRVYCRAHKDWIGPGQVLGISVFETADEARASFEKKARIKATDFYLGPKFFPE